MRLLLLAILLATCLCAQSAEPPTFDLEASSSPSAEQATVAQVFLLRSNSITGATRLFSVHVDEKKIAKLPWRRTYANLQLSEGTHKVRISCPSGCTLRPLEFQAHFVAGREYYFLIDPAYKRKVNFEMSTVTESTVTFTSQVRQIDRDEYLRLVASYKDIKTL